MQLHTLEYYKEELVMQNLAEAGAPLPTATMVDLGIKN
jgi:hypothetical protein